MNPVSYTHLRAHETREDLVCRLLLEKKVRLLREHYESKSLTAIAIAAHEVGHAIQDHQGDKRLATRTKMVPVIDKVARWSALIISVSPVICIITRHPMPFSLLLIVGLSGFIARMMVHAVTLPIEFDASFSKALPLLLSLIHI